MATMRTPEEKMKIVERCVELEKEGGDILAYLWSENYMTPRATWYNFQREYLGRKRYEYTEGKPNEGRFEKAMKRKLTPEREKKAIEIAIEGGDPRPFLARECNMKDPVTAWWKLRSRLKDEDPETFAKLPDRLPNAGWTSHNDVFHNPKPKVDKGMPKTLELEGGQDYQLKVAETPEGFHNIRGVNDPKPEAPAKPVAFGDYEVTAIRDKELGEFYFDTKFNVIDWRTLDGDEVSMNATGWRNLADAIPKILGVLGVKV